MIFEITEIHWRFFIGDPVSKFSSEAIFASLEASITLQGESHGSWRYHSNYSNRLLYPEGDLLISKTFADLSHSKEPSVCEFSPT